MTIAIINTTILIVTITIVTVINTIIAIYCSFEDVLFGVAYVDSRAKKAFEEEVRWVLPPGFRVLGFRV